MKLDPEIARVFLEEAALHLQTLEDETKNLAIRKEAAQDLKGAAGLVGLSELQALAQAVEGAIGQGHVEELPALVGSMHALMERTRSSNKLDGEVEHEILLDAEEMGLLRSLFVQEAHEHLDAITAALLSLEKDPTHREPVDALLRTTHTLKGSAATVRVHAVAEAAHRLEDVFAQLRDAKRAPDAALFDPLMSVLDALRALVDSIEEPETIPEHLGRVHRLLGELSCAEVPSGPHPPSPPAADAPKRDERQLLRVDAMRLDELMNSVGELVFDRTRIERRVQEMRSLVRSLARTRTTLRTLLTTCSTGDSHADRSLLAKLAELEWELSEHTKGFLRGGTALIEDTEVLRRTTDAVQTGLTHMRMLPLSLLFGRLARPVRDMARQEGKHAELITAGEDTELDKAVAERVLDPLVQILRNAIAHGIESPEVRAERGKPPVGRISLSARHQGDAVLLEIADDGGGVDTEKLRRSLVAAGRLSAASASTDDQILAAIFETGVSSRDTADELAGRGIGLDVARRAIAGMGGDITLTSTAGKGTTFTIRLPLTASLMQALLFKVGGEVYALPSIHVGETTLVEGREGGFPALLRLRHETIPLVSLHRLVGASTIPARAAVVVLEFAGKKLAVTCDKIVGSRDIVVKSLGPLLAPLGLYSGATISGAGKVQLILDPSALVQIAYPPGQKGDDDKPRAPDSEVPHGPPLRILLVDDSRTVRESLSRMLSSSGFVVDLAVDGTEAWTKLQSSPYDLLLTDLEMPKMDGFTLMDHVQRTTSLQTMPIIVISSRTGASDRARARQAGARAFLAKPITRPTITGTIFDLLGTR